MHTYKEAINFEKKQNLLSSPSLRIEASFVFNPVLCLLSVICQTCSIHAITTLSQWG